MLDLQARADREAEARSDAEASACRIWLASYSLRSVCVYHTGLQTTHCNPAFVHAPYVLHGFNI